MSFQDIGLSRILFTLETLEKIAEPNRIVPEPTGPIPYGRASIMSNVTAQESIRNPFCLNHSGVKAR